MYDVQVVSALTPNSYKNLKNFEITYGFYQSPFGDSLIGLHDNILCYWSFKTEQEISDPIERLKRSFPAAGFVENQAVTTQFADHIFKAGKATVKVLLYGTEFQINVWKALLQIQVGSTASYEDVANAIGHFKAVRAVANAVANNKIAFVIPCHRVIRKNGQYVGKYRWGVKRKIKILEYEGVCTVQK